jgi:hypothetical protein
MENAMFGLSRTALALGSLLTLAPFAAEAACSRGDHAGTWSVFVARGTGNDFDWARCRLDISSTGVVATATSGCKDRGNVESPVLTSSRLVLRSDCRLSGNVYLLERGLRTRYIVVDGQLDRSKETMSGVGTYPSGGRFTFNGVLQ